MDSSTNLLLNMIRTFKSYPRAYGSLEQAPASGINMACHASRTFRTEHGVYIRPYDTGWITDSSEKNLNFEVSDPQTDIFSGHCTCTVGSALTRKLFGGGIVPTKRPILSEDGFTALALSTTQHRKITNYDFTTLSSRIKLAGFKVYICELQSLKIFELHKDKTLTLWDKK